MRSNDGGVDWEAGERAFVEGTGPQITLREFSTLTPEMAWTSYQSISYQTIRDVAKANLWIKKRAKYLYETRPGLTENVEIVYSIVLHQLVDLEEDLSARDISALTSQFLQLHDRMLAQRPLDVDMDTRETLTRDGIVDIIRTVKPLSDEDLLKAAAEIMERVSDDGV